MALGIVKYLKNPFTGNFVFPVTRTKAVYNDDGSRLDKYLDTLKSLSGNNILINSNFANPVNQRGYVSERAVTSFEFVLDRWLLQYSGTATQTSLKINKGYVTIKAFAGTKYNDLFQKVEFAESYAGKTLTLSAKYRCRSGGKATLYAYNGGSTTDAQSYPKVDLVCDGDWHTSYITFTAKEDIQFLTASISPGTFEWDGTVHKWEELAEDLDLDIEWMKLELGESPTHYAPRLYAEELQLCKRYYQVLNQGNGGVLVYLDPSLLAFNLYGAVQMRSKPTPVLGEVNVRANTVTISDFTYTVVMSVGDNSINPVPFIKCEKASHGLSYEDCLSINAIVHLDAEL